MKAILSFLAHFMLICIYHLSAQPVIQWQKSLGGTGTDFAYSVQQSMDGGYIVGGYSNSDDGDVSYNHGDYDYWVVRLDESGNILWEKALGGTNYDEAFSIQQTTDSGYIIAGDVTGNDGDNDIWLVKLDESGNILWEKALGGTYSDFAFSIQQTTDGGYIVAGSTSSNDGDVSYNHGGADVWVVKLDESGNIVWEKSLGGTYDETAFSIQQTTDDGYIVAGRTYSNDGDVTDHYGLAFYIDDYWVVKLDESGNILWQKSLGGTNYDQAYSIRQTTDGEYIVAGYTSSNDENVTVNHGYQDYWVARLDESGNILWEKSLGGTYGDYGYSMWQTADGGYIVAGLTWSDDGDVTDNYGQYDYWLVKLDSSGYIIWQKSFGGTGYDNAASIQQTTDGGYIIAGSSSSDDGDVTGNHGDLDYWIVKLEGCSLPMNIAPDVATICAGSSVILSAVNGVEFEWSPSTSLDTTMGAEVTASPTETTTYTVTAIDSAGCSTSDTVMVIVNALPVAVITSDQQELCTGIFTSYQWQSDGINISGAISQCFTVTESGNYTVMVTDSNGCTATSDAFIFTSIENSMAENNFTVFPNPFTNSTTISFNVSQSQNVVIKIYDFNGRLIKVLADNIFNGGENEITWNADDDKGNKVSDGIYLLNMQTSGFNKTQKLIVSK